MKQSKLYLMQITALLCAVLTASFHLTAVPVISAQAAAPASQTAETPDLSPEAVYNAMIAFQTTYPEGTPYTNNNYYGWKGGVFSGGYGCAGFAFMLSDAAFGTLPARMLETFDEVRPGDILRINNDSHFVIILQVTDTGVVVAEGNYGGKVHWGRTFTKDQVFSSMTNYMLTRYPAEVQYLTGDIDNNKRIEVDDAQYALNAYISYLSHKGYGLTDAQFTAGDIDGDKKITTDDAQDILQYYIENTLGKKGLTWKQIINQK